MSSKDHWTQLDNAVSTLSVGAPSIFECLNLLERFLWSEQKSTALNFCSKKNELFDGSIPSLKPLFEQVQSWLQHLRQR